MLRDSLILTNGKREAGNALYPSIMINFNFISRACEDPELFRKIYNDRLEYKKQGDPRNKSMKLVLNSSYGICKDRFSKMYDPHMANAICITGQLLLTDLIDKIENVAPQAQLVNSNTDGVLYLIPDDECDKKLMSAVDLWMQRTGLTMERTDYVELHQRDVNNYLLITSSGKVKGKGVLKEQNPLDYNCPIVKEAIREYFVHGTKVEDTINNCDEYIKFQIVYKRSAKFDCVIHNDCCYTDKRVFRVFADKRNCNTSLYRGKREGDELNLTLFPNCPPSVFIDNGEVKGRKVPSNVNKRWYIDAARRELSSWFGDGLGLAD